jgi:hypothetical protein
MDKKSKIDGISKKSKRVSSPLESFKKKAPNTPLRSIPPVEINISPISPKFQDDSLNLTFHDDFEEIVCQNLESITNHMSRYLSLLELTIKVERETQNILSIINDTIASTMNDKMNDFIRFGVETHISAISPPKTHNKLAPRYLY